MKTLFLVMMFAFCGSVKAADGYLMYESASSSITHATVSLSSSSPTLISKATTTTVADGTLPVSWYSLTLFNVNTTTAAYGWSNQSGVAPVPALTCADGVPLGAGSPTAPWNQTEQFFGAYMWGISCTNAAMNLKVVYRGR